MWVERSYLEVKVWRSSEMQHSTGTLRFCLSFLSTPSPHSCGGLAIRLASWSTGQVKVKVRGFAGALTTLNQHAPFGPVKGHSGRAMPEMVTSRPCYAWGQLLGANSTSSSRTTTMVNETWRMLDLGESLHQASMEDMDRLTRTWPGKPTLCRFSARRALTEVLQGTQQARLSGTFPCLDSGLTRMLQTKSYYTCLRSICQRNRYESRGFTCEQLQL